MDILEIKKRDELSTSIYSSASLVVRNKKHDIQKYKEDGCEYWGAIFSACSKNVNFERLGYKQIGFLAECMKEGIFEQVMQLPEKTQYKLSRLALGFDLAKVILELEKSGKARSTIEWPLFAIDYSLLKAYSDRDYFMRTVTNAYIWAPGHSGSAELKESLHRYVCLDSTKFEFMVPLTYILRGSFKDEDIASLLNKAVDERIELTPYRALGILSFWSDSQYKSWPLEWVIEASQYMESIV